MMRHILLTQWDPSVNSILHCILKKDGATKADDFSEKIQTAFNSPPPILNFYEN